MDISYRFSTPVKYIDINDEDHLFTLNTPVDSIVLAIDDTDSIENTINDFIDRIGENIKISNTDKLTALGPYKREVFGLKEIFEGFIEEFKKNAVEEATSIISTNAIYNDSSYSDDDNSIINQNPYYKFTNNYYTDSSTGEITHINSEDTKSINNKFNKGDKNND